MSEQHEYVRTGVRALADRERVMRDAYSTPLIGKAPSEPWRVVHGCALEAGLPEISGHYGYDFEAHEFIRLPDAAVAKPTAPAAIRVLEMLGHPALRITTPQTYQNEFGKIELSAQDEFPVEELRAALVEYRASLVEAETLTNARALALAAASANKAMWVALKMLPDDMRETVRKEAFPERA